MPLPKISSPMFDVVIPSTNKKIKMRPMVVREEKILLMAKESQDEVDVLEAVKQVVNNCLIDQSIDVEKLATFDIEYLFIKLRSISISNVVEVAFRDNEDNQVRKFNIDLNEVKIDFGEDFTPGKPRVIKASDDVSISLRYPSAKLYSEKKFENLTSTEAIDEMIIDCIDKVYERDEAFSLENCTKPEIREFIDSLSVSVYDDMRKFLSTTPKLSYTIEYKNNNGKDRKIELRNLTDFFTLR